MDSESKCIIIYDGYCSLCNKWVLFLLKRDKEDVFRFVPFQNIPEEKLPSEVVKELADTVTIFYHGRFHVRSAAVFIVLGLMGAPWKFLSYLSVFPAVLSDYLYDIVARNRLKWFGRKDECGVMPPGYRHKFIDSIKFPENPPQTS